MQAREPDSAGFQRQVGWRGREMGTARNQKRHLSKQGLECLFLWDKHVRSNSSWERAELPPDLLPRQVLVISRLLGKHGAPHLPPSGVCGWRRGARKSGPWAQEGRHFRGPHQCLVAPCDLIGQQWPGQTCDPTGVEGLGPKAATCSPGLCLLCTWGLEPPHLLSEWPGGRRVE